MFKKKYLKFLNKSICIIQINQFKLTFKVFSEQALSEPEETLMNELKAMSVSYLAALEKCYGFMPSMSQSPGHH